MDGIIRRREMVQADTNRPLYALTTVTDKYNGQLYVTTSNGNHVYTRKRWGTANVSASISNWDAPLFSIESGDTITIIINCTQKTTGNFRIPAINGATFANITSTGESTLTGTATSSGSVSTINIFVASGAANSQIEFDIEMYVNGIRYI